MATLLELKQNLKNFYIKYEFYITLAWKFLLAIIALSMINSKLGYQEALGSPLIVLMCALLCAILPANFIVIISALFTLTHLMALSMETAAIGLVLFLIMFLLYYRFSPRDTIALILTPICFCFHIPYVIPIAFGLLSTPAAAVSVSFGIVTNFYLDFIATNAATFRDTGVSVEPADAASRVQSIIEGVFQNKAMFVTIIVFALVTIIVYCIRRLSIDHSWDIAIVVGTVFMMISILLGDVIYGTGVSILGVIFGSVLAACIAEIIQFFSFNLDYKRTENVQFEDDDYYYYVKAVPKVSVPAPDRKVKQINRAHKTENSPEIQKQIKKTIRTTQSKSANTTNTTNVTNTQTHADHVVRRTPVRDKASVSSSRQRTIQR